MKIVNDNYLYAKLAKFIDDKAKLSEDKIPDLIDILGDEDKAKEVVEAAKASMGRTLMFLFLITLFVNLSSFLFTCSCSYLQDRIYPQLT